MSNSGFLVPGKIGPVAIGGGATPWYLAGGAPTPIAAYQPKSAASLAASYVNLANPGTYDAAPGVAPTLAAGGWQGNGSAYLTTGIVPASGYSMLIRFSGGVNGGEMLAGSNLAAGVNARFFIANGFAAIGPNNVIFGNGNYIGTIPYLSGGGVLAVAGQHAYRNGSVDGAAIGAWDTVSDKEIYILGRNNNGTAAAFFTGIISHLAIWNSQISAAQVAAITSAVAA